MRIQHNIAALNSHRNLTGNNAAVSKNLEKLSSGYRINRAGDDAAGLAISEKMRAQITGLQTAQKNAEDGVSLVQTAEGALTEVHSMLNRMVELATQSANGTYSKQNREEMQKEVDALKEEIDRISNTSNFNGKYLFKETPGEGEEVTAMKITDPTAKTVTFTAGTGTAEETATFDFAGVSFDKDGTVTVTVGGQDIDVEVTAGMSADDFAAAFETAYNDAAITDTDAGLYTAAASGTGITITSANKAAGADGKLDNTALVIKEKVVEETPDAPMTDPTSKAVAFTAGTGTAEETATFDFAGVSFDKDGTVTVTVGGQDIDVEVTAGMSADDFAAAFETAYNDAAITDTDAGLYTAAASGTSITITSANKAAGADGKLDNTALAIAFTEKPVEGNNEKPITGRETSAEPVKVNLHVGESVDAANTIEISIDAMNTNTLGSAKMSINTLNILNSTNAKDAITAAKEAIDQVSSIRSSLGAMQNRLEHTINNLGVQTENITAAESRIRDVDMAKEMMNFTKNNILVQASQAMLAQANQVPQGVLQLLQ